MIDFPLFTGIDPAHWLHSAWLAAGDVLPRRATDGVRGIVRLLVEGGRCIKADHTRRGPLDCAGIDPADLARVAADHDAAAAIAFERDLPERLIRRAAEGLRLEMDVTAQAQVFVESWRAELGTGVRVWPTMEPAPARLGPLNLAIKAALPAGELLVAVIYSEDGAIRDRSGAPIVTSGIFRFNSRPQLDLCATTAALSGITVRNWRTDWREINNAARALGKIFVAFHLPDAVLPELFSAGHAGRAPAALIDLQRRGRIIIDPFPLRLRALFKMGNLFKR